MPQHDYTSDTESVSSDEVNLLWSPTNDQDDRVRARANPVTQAIQEQALNFRELRSTIRDINNLRSSHSPSSTRVVNNPHNTPEESERARQDNILREMHKKSSLQELMLLNLKT